MGLLSGGGGTGLKHRYRSCRKRRCREPLCVAYRRGLAENTGSAYAEGFADGQATTAGTR